MTGEKIGPGTAGDRRAAIVLAALDASAAARPVLETAIQVASLSGAEAAAVHVRETAESAEVLRSLAERRRVPLRYVDGPVGSALLDAVRDPAVSIAVIGARATPVGRRPVGATALRILQRVRKPIVVVPPEAVPAIEFRRLLVPLEGTEESSRPVVERMTDLFGPDIDLVVLHVFTADTVPRMMDRPLRDLGIMGGEFLARHLPFAARVEFRTGPVDARVDEVVDEVGADIVVLSWSQSVVGDHAAVIRGVLSRSTVPVLLVPIDGGAAPRPSSASASAGLAPPG